jgi:hypothetical protein
MPQRVLEGFWKVRVFEAFLAKATPTKLWPPLIEPQNGDLKFIIKIWEENL